MWVKTEKYLVDAYCFFIEETKNEIEGYYWLVIAENKERNIVIGKYKDFENAKRILDYLYQSIAYGWNWVAIKEAKISEVAENENFDVRR